MTPSLAAVIFDLDGVLVDTMGFHKEAWAHAFREAGVPFGDEDLEREIYEREGAQSDKIATALYHKYTGSASPSDVNAICEAKQRKYLRLSEGTRVVPGIESVLEVLQTRSIPAAVVTGSPRDAASAVLNRLFPGVFSVVVTGDDVDSGKPAPDPYLKALEQLGIPDGNQCLIVENAPFGVRSGVSAGVPVVGVLGSSPLRIEDLAHHGASPVFRDHEELRRYLLELPYGDVGERPK